MSEEMNTGGSQEELTMRAVLGEQVHKFMNTDMGHYLRNRAADEEFKALKKLRECDPENAGLIRQYQNEALVAESVIKWLEDSIADGLQALRIIDDRNES